MSETSFTLLVRLSNGERMEVNVEKPVGNAPPDSSIISVKLVKDCIAKQDSGSPANRQRLVYKGRILEDERMLSDYGIAKGATLFLVKSAAPASENTSASTATSTSPSVPRPAGTNANPSAVPNPMMNPFGMPNMGGSMGMGQPPNPQQMQNMLNSPHMQGLLDNPEMLQNILQHSMQTPQMQQLMEQNPELRQVWNDPAMMQQAIQMMRNPQHMQQVMRQQDLQMSQLENLPGGMSALSRMYRDVQEPMMEAAQASRQGDSSGSNSANTPRSSSADGATGAAMPNPWGSPAPSASPRASTTTSQTNSPFGGAANPWAAMAGAGAANNPFGGAGGMPNPWGEGAGGMPGMMGGQPPNMDQMRQMLNNPAMSQMMNDMVQNNPDMLRTMMEAQNPMLRQMFQGNPEMANNFIRQTFNPVNMRAMMDMQQSMQGGGGMPDMSAMSSLFGMPSPNATAPAPGSGGPELDFSNLLQQFQSTGLGGVRPAPPANPAERYRNQLQQLYNMGFDDEQANLRVLEQNHGNLNRAVDQLLSAPPAPSPAPAAVQTSQPSTTEDSEPAENSTPKDTSEKKND